MISPMRIPLKERELEVRLSRTQAAGYSLLMEKLQAQERIVNLTRRQVNEFLSDCVRESGHKPGPEWQLDMKTMTLWLPKKPESSEPNQDKEKNT